MNLIVGTCRLFNANLRRGFASKAADDIFATDSNVESSGDPFEITTNIPEAEESLEREEKFRQYVERMRDVSRFSKVTAAEKHRGSRVPTYSDPEALYLKKPSYFRRIYSKFGRLSGIEPGVAWLNKTEMLNLINEEKEHNLSLEQKINIFIKRKQEEMD